MKENELLEKLAKMDKDYGYDEERLHGDIDDLMIKVLKELGYKEFANACDKLLGKCWYS